MAKKIEMLESLRELTDAELNHVAGGQGAEHYGYEYSYTSPDYSYSYSNDTVVTPSGNTNGRSAYTYSDPNSSYSSRSNYHSRT